MMNGMFKWITGIGATITFGLALLLSVGANTQSSDNSQEDGKTDKSGPPDAKTIWSWMQQAGYKEWAPWPGQDGDFYEGTRPHGAQLKVYINRTAAGDIDKVPPGSVIVKENYSPEKKLAAITIMKRIENYDPDNQDWYWVKYLPDGSVATTQGRKAAGKVSSCIGCHRAAKGGDYIFANDEIPGRETGD
jgi:hypothetical protein